MLAYNQPLISAGDQLSKLKSIKKWPSLLSVDTFYAMTKAVIPNALPEAICLRGGLILGDLLASLVINNNRIISGVPNYIPSPSNLWYVVKKSCEATLMRIAGFVYNFTYSMSCNKGERAGIGRLIKEIAFYGYDTYWKNHSLTILRAWTFLFKKIHVYYQL